MYLCTRINAPVAELVDALDLGSSVYDVQVRFLSGALFSFCNKIAPLILYYFLKDYDLLQKKSVCIGYVFVSKANAYGYVWAGGCTIL